MLTQRWLRNRTNAELRQRRAEERWEAGGEADSAGPWESEEQQQAAYAAEHAQVHEQLASPQASESGSG